MTSPTKCANKKLKLETEEVEKTGNKATESKESETTKTPKDKTFSLKSPEKRIEKPLKVIKDRGVEVPQDSKENEGTESKTKRKSPRKVSKPKFNALKIKLKSPKKATDAPKTAIKLTPKQIPVSPKQDEKTSSQQKLKVHVMLT